MGLFLDSKNQWLDPLASLVVGGGTPKLVASIYTPLARRDDRTSSIPGFMYSFSDDMTPPWYFVQMDSGSVVFAVTPEFKEVIDSNGWLVDNSFTNYVNSKMYCHGYQIGQTVTITAVDEDTSKTVEGLGDFYQLYTMVPYNSIIMSNPSITLSYQGIILSNNFNPLGNKLYVKYKSNVQNSSLLSPDSNEIDWNVTKTADYYRTVNVWSFSVGVITEDQIMKVTEGGDLEEY